MNFQIQSLSNTKCLHSVLLSRACGIATKIGECGATIWLFPWMLANFKRPVGHWVA